MCKERDENTLVYKVAWTDTIDDNFCNDFLFVENIVFKEKMSKRTFNKKYIDNIYGPSVLVVAYIDGSPVGADALWRNDIGGRISFQSADTCVLPAARGKGIFMGMVSVKLETIKNHAIIYGFPNANSISGFIKSGWYLFNQYYTTLLISPRWLLEEAIFSFRIDRAYAEWWYSGNECLYSIKKQGHWWLVAKRKPFLYSILGELSDDAVALFPRLRGFNFFVYKSHHRTWYNKNRTPMTIITSPTTKAEDIPLWKIDSI